MSDIPAFLAWARNADSHIDTDTLLAACDEVERMVADNKNLRELDQEASEVEAVIVMRSGHFTGHGAYVGWKGLALALRRDYDERDNLREENDLLREQNRLLDEELAEQERRERVLNLARGVMERDADALRQLKDGNNE